MAFLDISQPGATTQRRLESPAFDIAVLMDVLREGGGSAIAWALRSGLFQSMSQRGAASGEDLVADTPLSARGVETLLGVLRSLNVVCHGPNGAYTVAEPLKEFLDSAGPYYIGPFIDATHHAAIPSAFLQEGRIDRLSERRLDASVADGELGTPSRLKQQHHRNFAQAVVAARSSAFNGIRHLVDVGGGSGVFGIPLALDHPGMKITLVELPRLIEHVRSFLDVYGVGDRIGLVGWSMFDTPWPVDDCDGVLFGNVIHACDDDECRVLLREAANRLTAGGRVLIHEILWHERKDGPVYTALMHLAMMSANGGRQRTAVEIERLLAEAGFEDVRIAPTAGYFSLITATKQSRNPAHH